MQEILLVKRLQSISDIKVEFDPTCFDKKIHIRLRDFNVDTAIAGFESKLTFVIEYLLHQFIKNFPSYSVDMNIKDDSEATKQYIFSKYVNEFKQSNFYKTIVNELKSVIYFEDISIKQVYSKKFSTNKLTQFGNIHNSIFNILGIDLDLIFNQMSIKTFLLDDSISLLITEMSEENLNEKYLNKNARKLSKQILKDNGYQENKLW